MKKIFIIVISLVSLFLCLFGISNDLVYADSNLQMLIVEGEGKAEATATTAVLHFYVSVNSEDFDKGQNEINQTFETLSSKAKENNENNLVYITYSSCYPRFNDSLKIYEFSCGINIKTKDLNNTNNLIEQASKSGNVSFNGIDYSIDDESMLYSQALTEAKENAIKKAQALDNNLTLKAIINTCVYTNSYEQSGKIIVNATIKAVFVNFNETEKTHQANEQKYKSFC